ncbi:MAG: CinA family nicotinamide mononucleotide deamidase-related protein [Bacteroidales bacterium]|nr:CinA family nicotinamide mononucleotide deamidase-related protein [Bacteroidales bacterium]
MKTASICTIGDEILIGQIVDTNSSHIARELNALGIQVRYMTSIGDQRAQILSELGKCLDNTDIVIVTGGLGPTRDDITKDALRELAGASGYKESPEQMAHIVRILGARGIPMIDTNRAQALVPDNCTVIPNKLGTAPCMAFYGLGANGGSALYSLPGVPFEALGLLPDVMADIRRHFSLEEITHHTIVTFGIPESTLAKKIEPWEDALPANIHLAYLPNPTIGVRLRLTQFGGQADFTPYIAQLQEILGVAIYGEGEDTLQSVIGDRLRAAGKTLALAESCTGGHLSELVTSVAGCSDYYKGSVTSYSNEVKMKALGVRGETLAAFGAVSEQCVREMASGVLRALDTDYAVATSGIAGPGGGSPQKPVGTAWLAAAKKNPDGSVSVATECVHFASSRAVNIERFASHALDLLRRNL